MGHPNTTIWIGLVALAGAPENELLGGSLGAYANMLIQANTAAEFALRAFNAARAVDLDIEEILWAEPLAERRRRFDIEDYLLSLAKEITSADDVRFGVLHCWENQN